MKDLGKKSDGVILTMMYDCHALIQKLQDDELEQTKKLQDELEKIKNEAEKRKLI